MLTLTPQARAIAVAALAFAFLIGDLNRIGLAVLGVAIRISGGISAKSATAIPAFTMVVVGMLLLGIASTARVPAEGWSTSLLQAGRAVIVAGIAIDLLLAIATLIGPAGFLSPLGSFAFPSS